MTVFMHGAEAMKGNMNQFKSHAPHYVIVVPIVAHDAGCSDGDIFDNGRHRRDVADSIHHAS